MFIYFLIVAILLLCELYFHSGKFSREGFKQWFREKIQRCYLQKLKRNNDQTHLMILTEITSKSQLSKLLIVFMVAKYKRTCDILQGISRLDYLVRVSIFQRQKNTSRDNLRGSVLSSKKWTRSNTENSTLLRDESVNFDMQNYWTTVEKR